MIERTKIVVLMAACLAGSSSLGRSSRELAKQELGILFYSDLGPDSIDVSSYPAQQKKNYTVYSRVCSQCHALARAVNSPVVGRDYWEMYLAAMRRRSYYAANPAISMEETKAILDFLEYDSKTRKETKEFAAQTDDLKRRFAAAVDQQLQKRSRRP